MQIIYHFFYFPLQISGDLLTEAILSILLTDYLPNLVNYQTSMDMKMLHYAKVVCDLNNFRLQKKPFGIATRLLDVAKNFEDKNMVRI
jgi:hypothetical protein